MTKKKIKIICKRCDKEFRKKANKVDRNNKLCKQCKNSSSQRT